MTVILNNKTLKSILGTAYYMGCQTKDGVEVKDFNDWRNKVVKRYKCKITLPNNSQFVPTNEQ